VRVIRFATIAIDGSGALMPGCRCRNTVKERAQNDQRNTSGRFTEREILDAFQNFNIWLHKGISWLSELLE
jgi:hypothetical protein